MEAVALEEGDALFSEQVLDERQRPLGWGRYSGS
jgi:hypothetical protein